MDSIDHYELSRATGRDLLETTYGCLVKIIFFTPSESAVNDVYLALPVPMKFYFERRPREFIGAG